MMTDNNVNDYRLTQRDIGRIIYSSLPAAKKHFIDSENEQIILFPQSESQP